MSTTVTLTTATELQQRNIVADQPIKEPSILEPSGNTNDPSLSSEGNVPVTRAASTKSKDDPYGYRSRKKTVLEQHVMFFDRDDDGVIWPTDTWHTVRGFGWGIRLSLFFTVFLHLAQSWGTVPWFWLIPDPLLRVWVHNIQNNHHGSSTMAFDHKGNFRQQFFDEFFAENDQDGKGGLTLREGFAGIRKHKFPWDIFGQVSDAFEWGMTYVMLWPEDGVIMKEDARRVLDGSIYHELTIKQQRKKNE